MLSEKTIKDFTENSEEFLKYNRHILTNFLSFLTFKRELEMSEDFKIGDVVNLKTNNKIDLVINDIENDKAVCVWIADDGKSQKEIYPLSCLVKKVKSEPYNVKINGVGRD